MAYALVYGGEHFVADIVAGWAMAAAAFALVAGVRGAAARQSSQRTTSAVPARAGAGGS